MSKYHEEYSLRHKVEFRPDEFADDPRTFAHPAIRIICAPNRYGIGDEQTWHRSQTPMPNHAYLPLYVMDHSAVHISLTPFAGAGPDAWQIGVVDIDISVRNEDINGTRCVSMCECVCTMKTAAHIIRNSFND